MIHSALNRRNLTQPRFAMSESANVDHQETPPSQEEKEKSVDASELSPEEQMAAFEEALKNSDWGHQPC